MKTFYREVLASREAWKSKRRIGDGKPQELFHKLMKNFNAHSDLLRIIPQGDKYTSLLTGSISTIVKVSLSISLFLVVFIDDCMRRSSCREVFIDVNQASANHSETIEDLSETLDSVTDAVAISALEARLIRSQAVQDAVAKLYIAIFLFFGDVIKWYKSSGLSKVRKSLHNNYSATFKTALVRVQKLAKDVHDLTQLGSQAEVRTVRLTVEELQEELPCWTVWSASDSGGILSVATPRKSRTASQDSTALPGFS